jgi:peroxiredoxin
MASKTLRISDPMPAFGLIPGVDGRQYSEREFVGSDVLVVVFSCNHCPYVQAYEDRMMELQREYAQQGVRLVAINSNETANYPEDNFEEMVKRAKARGFNFAYLRDDDQKVAGAFGATHTPEFFVFDKARNLRYHGKMDDNWKEPKAVKERYLRDAVEAVLKGTAVTVPETFSIGCTIKWR